MAGKRISELSTATSVAPSDVIPITQGWTGPDTGTTRLVSVAQISANYSVTATGGTVARNLPKIAGNVLFVDDFGAKGDGITDDTVAINAAFAAQAGSTIALRGGQTYYVSATLFLPQAGLTILGNGATIKPALKANWTPVAAAGTAGLYYIVHYGSTTFAPGYNQSHVHIEKLTFRSSNGGQWNGHAINIENLQDITVKDVTNWNCDDTVAIVGCKNTLIEGCRSYYALNAGYDFWGGCTNAIVRDCYAYACGSGVNFNSIASLSSDTYTSTNCLIDGCVFENVSGASCFITPLGTGATVRNVKIRNCTFLNTGATIAGAYPQGVNIQAGDHVTVEGNFFDGWIGSTIYAATDASTAHTTNSLKVLNNRFRNVSAIATPSTACILACGPHAHVEGNVADAATVTCSIGIQVDDPTSYVGQNDIIATNPIYNVVNGHPYGGSTTPAMQMDVDRVNRNFNFRQPIKATSIDATPIGSTTPSTGAFTTASFTGLPTFYVGGVFGSTASFSSSGSSVTDLSKQITLAVGYGFNTTAARINAVVPTGGSVVTVVNGVDTLTINAGGITASAGVGAFNHAPPASQPAAPVTLSDVIAIIRGCGLSA